MNSLEISDIRFRDKFYNSGLPPLYTYQSYRNYYHEISFHKNKYGLPAPTNFEIKQWERYGSLRSQILLNLFQVHITMEFGAMRIIHLNGTVDNFYTESSFLFDMKPIK